MLKMKLTIFLCALLTCPLIAACQQRSKNSQTGSPEKRYQVKGKVVSVEKAEKRVKLDHEDIKDAAGKIFMDAMQMSFKVRDDQALEKLAPGDQVQATLVYNENNNLSWLEKITIKEPAKP
ncbi:MAG TPA: copper-binding protein [Blastocatellia bacterium]|nr:copper-binding protein [Blastocatellia bacterium]